MNRYPDFELRRRRLCSHLGNIRAVFVVLTFIASHSSVAAHAGGTAATARAAIDLFAQNCFSPFMTAEKARKTFALSGITYDFYDLDPFSSAAPSPATGRPVTIGTDRRCEVAFAGRYSEEAAQAAEEALREEGITTPAQLPAAYTATDTTTLLAARQLNPRRTAIVHVGTREGPQGTETFMLVERLTRSETKDN